MEDKELESIRKRKLETLKTKVEAGKTKPAPSVIVYSTPDCRYCAMAKEYLSNKGVRFDDIDVSANREKAREMVMMSGQGGVPVLVINGRIVVGFDRPLIDDALSRPAPPRRDAAIQNLSFDLFDR
jgi:glutaredoxin 3